MVVSKEWIVKFLGFFGYLMAVVYIGLGIMLFIPGIYTNIPGVLKYTIALFFIAYGLFRLVKLLTKKTESKD